MKSQRLLNPIYHSCAEVYVKHLEEVTTPRTCRHKAAFQLYSDTVETDHMVAYPGTLPRVVQRTLRSPTMYKAFSSLRITASH